MVDRPEQFALLMRDVKDGSESAVRRLLELYGEHVYRAVRRHLNRRLRSKFDSDDFAQAVWASVFAHREAIGQFDRPERLIAFLARVASNKVIDEGRARLTTAKRDLRREQSLDDSLRGLGRGIADHGPSPSQAAIANEQWEGLTADLPPHYRRILQMRSEGYTNAETAAQLGLNEKTVRRVLLQVSARLADR